MSKSLEEHKDINGTELKEGDVIDNVILNS